MFETIRVYARHDPHACTSDTIVATCQPRGSNLSIARYCFATSNGS